jgi:predicted nucleic acid-binding protein
MPDANNAFLDSNIVLYALDADITKRDIAWKLLFSRPCISLQVLTLFLNRFNDESFNIYNFSK